MKLGKLEKIRELREVWKDEANDFTPWLAEPDNIVLLGDAINLTLEVESTEKDVGPFRADILCREEDNNSLVLVENQIERTDHTHLGQLLTYAAGLDTVTIVWIARSFRDEHRAALDWLNEVTGEKVNFFGIEIELWKIEESEIAPRFSVVSKPNNWTKGKVGSSKVLNDAELTPTKKLQLDFWKAFREYVQENSSTIRPQAASAQQWMNFGIGTTKAFMLASLNTRDRLISVSLQVQSGENRWAVFCLLEEDKEAIEKELGCSVEWEEKPERKSSSVTIRNPNLDPNNRDDWEKQQKWMLEQLENFREVFGKRIKTMDVGDWRPEDIESEDG